MATPRKKPEDLKKRGPETSYTDAIAKEICARLMCGETLIDICEDPDMPAQRTVHGWLLNIPEFPPMYAHAREVQADAFADQNIIIARTFQIGETITEKGDGTVEIKRGDMIEHRRLNIDTRKWYASKLNRRRYGSHPPRGGDDGESERNQPPVNDEPPRV